jgi:hypothetical protein
MTRELTDEDAKLKVRFRGSVKQLGMEEMGRPEGGLILLTD